MRFEWRWISNAALAVAALAISTPALAQGAAPANPEPREATPIRLGAPIETTASPFLGAVPTGTVSSDPLPLSLNEAIERALRHNLGVLLQEQAVKSAEGARWRMLGELLPTVSSRVAETRQVVNLKAFGFGEFPGVPTILGPFNVFDARVYLSQRVVDFSALYDTRAEAATVRAEQQSLKSARDFVVLVAANLYLQAVSGVSRLDAARAQLETAQALHTRANDLKAAGLVAGIVTLRAEAQVQTARQRVIAAENELQKQRLQLARAIGIPLGQVIQLTDSTPYAAIPPLTLPDALDRAMRSRADLLAAEARLQAAEAERKSAASERWPTLQMNADFGDIGPSIADSHSTYSVAANVRVPIFDPGRIRARVLESEALVNRRRSELADFRARVEYELRTALLDLTSADELLKAAQLSVTLADQELTQARDRFSAGVSDNLEVVQAQESVARATESYISSLYAHNIAKAQLARALGIAEEATRQYLGGVK